MPIRDKIESAVFTGVRNGRPNFDFGNRTAPPDWLLKLERSGKVEGDQFIFQGKPLEVGCEIRGFADCC